MFQSIFVIPISNVFLNSLLYVLLHYKYVICSDVKILHSIIGYCWYFFIYDLLQILERPLSCFGIIRLEILILIIHLERIQCPAAHYVL